jgi:phosphomannomutase
LQTGSCVSVTGSHNPPDYNGFKIVLGGETLAEGAMPNWAWPSTATATGWASSPADGKVIMPDRQYMLLVADVLQRVPGAQIIYDVKCTQRLKPWIEQHGGRPLMWKTGHSLAKAKLKETGAPIAGELSGHIFFSERWYGFDDGMYTAARMLEILSRVADPSSLLNGLPDSVNTPELNVACAEGEHHAIVERCSRSPNSRTPRRW